jgi:hypothetical protein
LYGSSGSTTWEFNYIFIWIPPKTNNVNGILCYKKIEIPETVPMILHQIEEKDSTLHWQDNTKIITLLIPTDPQLDMILRQFHHLLSSQLIL